MGFNEVILNLPQPPSIWFVLIATTVSALLYPFILSRKSRIDGSDEKLSNRLPENPKRFRPATKPTAPELSFRELEFYKDLFFKLQNLESYPDVLPIARQSILWLLSEALKDYTKSPQTNILSLETFDEEKLCRFLGDHHSRVTAQYKEYIELRDSGGPRQLVRDRHDAERWLRKIAPLKLVDGAWLGHLNKISIPFALRPIMKKTWQIFTEELGDGNHQQHHVYIYEELLRQVEPDLPKPTTKEILHPRYGFNSIKYWRGAVAQLMISLFPEEFFPEILGFNMHFEMLQLDTMQAAKELPEVGFDPYYFLLHVSIDNSHSGHAAMSMECPVSYVQQIEQTKGKEAARIAWRRVQAGYILSEWLASTKDEATGIPLQINRTPCSQLESRVTAIFRAKAQAAQGLHCGCKVKIGNRHIDEWLSPGEFGREKWQKDFVDSLSRSKPWVYPGDSNKSRLVRELRWGGKMFGSFTRDELLDLEHWIDSLRPHRIPFYYDFVGLAESAPCQGCEGSDVAKAVFGTSGVSDDADDTLTSHSKQQLRKLEFTASDLDLTRLLPLWITQCCLLESYVYAPARTSDKIGCAVVRLLRAQLGFETEGIMVTGIDEPHHDGDSGIVGIGLEMIRRAFLPVPPDLKSVLARWPSSFAEKMLRLSSKPLQNFGTLLGISMALLELQEVVSKSADSGIISSQSGVCLQELVRRQYHQLEECRQCISTDEKLLANYSQGYAMALLEIEKCVKSA
ncbi:hypothetical protein N7532_002391 [Penicillium argentinense]|uniref:Uncharacterized protein n=1 Tax=Penicillium argentinense TaxID=1131581 RepID=A0A9W9G0G0_9EURO|nr:uncharacterized protein N7532_002391 [Penicillium argentinense]KAJ5109746.1 hypothetical protein N7532_002391 [Penicillium argentinense]